MNGVSDDEFLLVDTLAIDEGAICRAAIFNENFAGWAVDADMSAGKLVIGGDWEVCGYGVASDGDVTGYGDDLAGAGPARDTQRNRVTDCLHRCSGEALLGGLALRYGIGRGGGAGGFRRDTLRVCRDITKLEGQVRASNCDAVAGAQHVACTNTLTIDQGPNRALPAIAQQPGAIGLLQQPAEEHW